MLRWPCVSLLLLMAAGASYATCVSGPAVVRRVVHGPVCPTPIVHHVPPVFLPTPVLPVAPVFEPVLSPVAVFAPLPVFVPSYTAGFNPGLVGALPAGAAPGGAPPVSVAPGAGMAEVMGELRKISARLDALERRGPGPLAAPPMPLADPPAKGKAEALSPEKGFLALATLKCAKCHLQGQEDKGGGLVLLATATTVARLDQRQLRRVASLSYSGAMPPRSSGIAALTDEEVGVVMGFVSAQK